MIVSFRLILREREENLCDWSVNERFREREEEGSVRRPDSLARLRERVGVRASGRQSASALASAAPTTALCFTSAMLVTRLAPPLRSLMRASR